MAKFRDSEGREWAVSVTIYDARRIKKELGVDLLDHRQVTAVCGDIIKAIDVLWLLCESQAKERQISDEAFGRSLGGDAIEAAIDALLGAMTDFFPKRQREILRGLLAKIDQAKEQAAALVEAKLPALDSLITTKLAEASAALDTTLGVTSGS